MRFILRAVERVTPFDTDLLDWSHDQEQKAIQSAQEIRRQNAIEADIMNRNKLRGSRP